LAILSPGFVLILTPPRRRACKIDSAGAARLGSARLGSARLGAARRARSRDLAVAMPI